MKGAFGAGKAAEFGGTGGAAGEMDYAAAGQAVSRFSKRLAFFGAWDEAALANDPAVNK